MLNKMVSVAFTYDDGKCVKFGIGRKVTSLTTRVNVYLP